MHPSQASEQRRRAQYIEYGGRVHTPPAFPSTGGRFRGFVLKADADCLGALCERLYNAPAGDAVEYRSLGAHVLMLLGSFREIRSSAEGYADVGFSAETQLSLWFPVAAGRVEGKRFHTERLCMAVPYIWVDNPMSLLGGREIYGFPKSLARFEPADGLGEHVHMDVYGGNFSRDSVATWRPLLSVRRGRSRPGEQRPAGESREGAAQARHPQRRKELALLARVVDELTHRRLRQLFLKQFRDVGGNGEACYQAVVEAPVTVTRASWRPSLRRWSVAFEHLDSHPVMDELGLESQLTRRSYSLEMDLVAEPGVVIAES